MDLSEALSGLTEEQAASLAEKLSEIRESSEIEDLKNAENDQN